MQHPFKRWRIDILLFGSFALLILLLLAAVGWGAFRLSSQQLAENTSVYQARLLKELNQQLGILRQSIERTSLSIARDPALLEHLAIRRDAYAKYRSYQNVINNLKGQVISSSTIFSIQIYMYDPIVIGEKEDIAMLPHDRLQGEAWYDLAAKSDFVWIPEREVVTDRGRKKVISFARKIYAPDLAYMGLIVINVKLEAFESVLRRNSEAQRLLLDSGNRPMTADSGTRLTPELLEVVRALEKEEGYMPMNRGGDGERGASSGEKALMVWSRAFPDGWMLIEITPWREIASGSWRLALTLFVLGLSALLPALLLTLYLSRQFTRPVRLLVRSMSGFTIHQPDTPLPNDYRNEFGSLFGGFRKLRERVDELYAAQQAQYARQKEAELQALQASINPHFLYNTLDQLNWMAIEAGHEMMSRVLELMGRMFRTTLSNGETWITLEEELNHTLCYLEIQQLRWKGELAVETEVEPDCLTLYVPKLTLQPLVENSMVHGFHGRHSGTVRILADVRDGRIRLQVTDDGVGLAADWRERRNRKTGGYGLRNIEERLDAYFGIDCKIVAEAPESGGTSVTLSFPALREKPEGGRSHVADRDH
jgi:Predicted signal transduction protein with a C-terminal ATPase domain